MRGEFSVSDIVGREDELKILESICSSKVAEFLVMWGRRRIGKTFLINNYFKNKGIYFELTGVKKESLHKQLANFAFEFALTFDAGENLSPPKSWQEAFNRLRLAIEKIKTNEKIILFFDELPWLATQKSGFLSALEHFWNRYFSRKNNAVLIVCGSAASWMINKILNDKGGLHGRMTREIRLRPFTLNETEQYLQSKYIDFDRKQIIDIYMVLGGVPKYLSYLEKGKSARQLINDLCFSNLGPLVKEFHRLYSSLFDNSDIHVQIIRKLAQKSSGLTKAELLKQVDLTSGGSSSNIIRELEESGFIMFIPSFGKTKVNGRYKLIDEFSLFYIDWMEPVPKFGMGEFEKDYWLKMQASHAWSTWSGYAFESICLKHIHQIKQALGLSAVNTVESTWVYQSAKLTKEQGAQIDLVIDRADRCINLCEIKYYDEIYNITKDYADKLNRKKQIFKKITETRKSLLITMISTFGIQANSHYLSVIDSQLTLDALFL